MLYWLVFSSARLCIYKLQIKLVFMAHPLSNTNLLVDRPRASVSQSEKFVNLSCSNTPVKLILQFDTTSKYTMELPPNQTR